MPIILFISLFLVFSSANACLNLNGKLSGSCIYRSEAYGDFNGSIDFNIQQKSCDQITIDGSTLSIPGQVEEKSVDGDVIQIVKLGMSWKNPEQAVLNFKYSMTVDQKDQRIDDVSLTGTFRQERSKIILEQTGIVDKDPVQIYCELLR